MIRRCTDRGMIRRWIQVIRVTRTLRRTVVYLKQKLMKFQCYIFEAMKLFRWRRILKCVFTGVSSTHNVDNKGDGYKSYGTKARNASTISQGNLLPGSGVVRYKPITCLFERLINRCELELWQIRSKLRVIRCLLELTVRFRSVEHKPVLLSNHRLLCRD